MDRLQQQLQRLQQDHDALQQQLHTGTRQPPAGPCATYQQLQHASGCDPPHLAQLPAAQGLVWSRGTSNVSTNRLHAGLRHSMQQPNSSTALGDGGSEPAAFAVQFSRALQAADADRTAAVRRAVAAEQEAAELRRHLTQQEQEILHLHRCAQWSPQGVLRLCLIVLPLVQPQTSSSPGAAANKFSHCSDFLSLK